MLKKITAVVLFGALSLGCSDDEGWDLEIVNQTSNSYDIYEDDGVGEEEFVKIGAVAPRDDEEVSYLQTDVNYTFRLVPTGGDVEDDVEHEKSFNQSSTKEQTWVVK